MGDTPNEVAAFIHEHVLDNYCDARAREEDVVEHMEEAHELYDQLEDEDVRRAFTELERKRRWHVMHIRRVEDANGAPIMGLEDAAKALIHALAPVLAGDYEPSREEWNALARLYEKHRALAERTMSEEDET